MTRLYPEEETCAVCGKVSTYSSIGSTGQMGPSDLDGRPSEMMRSTLPFWIRACPKCTFVAPKISAEIEGARDIIASDEYKAQLKSMEFPKLASLFLCYAQLQRHAGQFGEAGTACLHATWACDDHGFEDKAVECRKTAAGDMYQALDLGQTFAGEGFQWLVLVDVLRRSGQFEKAGALCDVLSVEELFALEVLECQKKLIKNQDTGCYTGDDAGLLNESSNSQDR